MRSRKSIKLAEAARANGALTMKQKIEALTEAQSAGVTHLDFCRARLLLEMTGGDGFAADSWMRDEERAGPHS